MMVCGAVLLLIRKCGVGRGEEGERVEHREVGIRVNVDLAALPMVSCFS